MLKFKVKEPYEVFRKIAKNPRGGWLAFYSCVLMLGWVGLLFWGVLSVANYIDPRVYDTLFQSREHVKKIGIPMVLLICFLFWLLSRPEKALHKNRKVMEDKIKGLYIKRTQRDYPMSFKMSVVREVESGELSIRGALGIVLCR